MTTATPKSANLTADNRLFKKNFLLLAGFYVGIPTGLALLFGAAESGSFTFVEKRYFFYYFLATNLPAWWAADICTRLVKAVLKPWQPPLLLVLIAGGILGLNLQGLWAPLRHSLFEPYLAEGSAFFQVFPWRYGDADYFIEAVIAWLSVSLIWVAANLLYIYLLGYPRFGYGPRSPAMPSAASTAAEPPDEPAGHDLLLKKLPPEIGTDIAALKAEEHYTRVYTTAGSALILMRFSDAIGMLTQLGGIQTHRSYWVNPAYIVELVREGRSTQVRLQTGLTVPVSRSYRVKVQESLANRGTQPT
ncbi:MAG: LytTR family DNA-binding domain-containing protein [Gammaproteobacteria bacterium]|jgi:hypothetical protein|nr:LytTR family DNA-binding domain-containing protein [Gammaproteobacteria bacterium]